MKKITKIFLTGVLSAIALTSCESDLTDLNIDKKHPSSLPSSNFLATEQYYSSYYMYTPSVNYNNFRFFTQQLAETTYTDETNYDLVTRNQPKNNFNVMYVQCINTLKLAKEALATETNSDAVANNKWVTLELEEILVWETLVDTYGDIPYSEAFDPDTTLAPAYDDAETIYVDLISRIDAAIAMISTSSSGYTSGGDQIYEGDMSQWKKFANSLKLRMALNMADVNPSLAKSTAEAAITSGVMTSNDDSYAYAFAGSTFVNPVYDNFVASGRNDFVPTELVIDMMNDTEDPRRAQWFTTVDGEYIGGVFGATNSFAYYSHYSDNLLGSTDPANLLSYAEVLFLKAEAAARGYSVGGTAATFYAAAITASMTEAGVSTADIATYIAANPYDSSNWKMSIGNEAYIALFDRAFAAWNFTRRLDYPILTNPDDSNTSTVPYRMPYSSEEYTLNGTNVAAAASAIGGDDVSTKLWWDVN